MGHLKWMKRELCICVKRGIGFLPVAVLHLFINENRAFLDASFLCNLCHSGHRPRWSLRLSARSFARTARTIHLLCTARFDRAVRCAHSFAHSLAPELMGKRFCPRNGRVDFISFEPTVGWLRDEIELGKCSKRHHLVHIWIDQNFLFYLYFSLCWILSSFYNLY